MTNDAAKARGFSQPQKVIGPSGSVRWYSFCPTCRADGPIRDYKGEASADARRHNEENHA